MEEKYAIPSNPNVVGKNMSGGFDPTRATKAEMDAFLDQLCGDKVYEGIKFWIPEEAAKHGIKTYDGRDN